MTTPTSCNHTALLVPAHNEAAVIAFTLSQAVRAGFAITDIYVVDDASTDRTAAAARRVLPPQNILTVPRSGKAGAIDAAIRHFQLGSRYAWLQLMDADSVLAPDYLMAIDRHATPGVVAICGQTKSLPGNWVACFRAYEYTISHDWYKTIQAVINGIAVMPGPATCIRTDVLHRLSWSRDILTEDFDITVQIHRLRLGRIAYAPHAHSWTQDPPTFPAYVRQVYRWYRGFFQVLRKYRIGTRPRMIDAVLLYLMVDGVAYMGIMAAMAVAGILGRDSPWLWSAFMTDAAILLLAASYAAVRMRRWQVVAATPMFYLLRLLNGALFMFAAMASLLPQRSGQWNTQRVEIRSLPALFIPKGNL